MKKTYYYILIIYLLSACGLKKVSIEQSQNVIFEYDENSPINYGDTIPVAFYNINSVGERTDVSKALQLNIHGEGLHYERVPQLLHIQKRPLQKDVDEIEFLSILKEKDDSVSYSQKLKLNFSGPLTIDLRGEHGEKGRGKIARLRPLFLSDGKTGKDGEDGEPGKDAQPIQLYIWKKNEMYYVRVELTKDGSIYYYQTTDNSNMLINNSGANGGEGGNGGSGSRGKKGDNGSSPGDGGHGGDAGNGGDGGNGGAIEVIVHPNAEDVRPTLVLKNEGGAPGQPGKVGDPGKGGKAAPGQKDGKDGLPGEEGIAGKPGKSGPKPIIKTETFNFKKW